MIKIIKLSKLDLLKISLLLLELLFFLFFNPLNSQTLILFLGIIFVVYDYYLILDFLIIRLSKAHLISENKAKKITITLSYTGGVLIMLESLGQLTFKDIIVIIMLAIIIYWYTWYVSDRHKVKN